MQITKNSVETRIGPAEWFTGTVHIDAVAMPTPDSRISANSVHFSPGARTAWHTHPHGQTIFVTEGIGRVQRRGGPVEEIRPGVLVSSSNRAKNTGTAPHRVVS